MKVVERMFGSQIFDAVMGQSDSVRKKPAPDGPLKIAEQFGIKPEECNVSGRLRNRHANWKSSRDVHGRCSVGIQGKRRTAENGADYLVDSPEDILDLYEEKCEE